MCDHNINYFYFIIYSMLLSLLLRSWSTFAIYSEDLSMSNCLTGVDENQRIGRCFGGRARSEAEGQSRFSSFMYNITI